MGKGLGQWVLPVFWDFSPKQMENPDKLIEYLEEVCCHPGNGNTEYYNLTGVWPMPSEPCSTLFSALKGKGGQQERRNKATGSTAAPAPKAATALTAGTAAAQTPATGTAVKPENQPTLVSVNSL